MPLARPDFNYIKQLVQETTQNVLEVQREYAVETRLQPIVESGGYGSIQGLIAALRRGDNDELKRTVVESLLNNETMFFRDMQPYEVLRNEILPRLMKDQANERTLNIWSAACSSGQEPYSIAMILHTSFPELKNWKVRIVGSDVSLSILKRARAARYRQIEVNRGLPAPYLVKYFTRDGLHWDLKPEIRDAVSFMDVNLTQPLPNTLPKFDLVFLRNVLLYFDVDTKRTILNQLETALKPNGYVFLGSAETTISLSSNFTRCFEKTACYQLRG